MTPGPELDFIKHRARADFGLAFKAALAELMPEERHLLRLHYLDGLGLAEIGAIDGVGKSAVSRRLTAVRQKLLAETQRRLREQLGLDDDEVASLMGAATSQLDVSIRALLDSRR
jgi:RNA polymerase sigma-70 factor